MPILKLLIKIPFQRVHSKDKIIISIDYCKSEKTAYQDTNMDSLAKIVSNKGGGEVDEFLS